jgi:hypothetical protein
LAKPECALARAPRWNWSSRSARTLIRQARAVGCCGLQHLRPDFADIDPSGLRQIAQPDEAMRADAVSSWLMAPTSCVAEVRAELRSFASGQVIRQAVRPRVTLSHHSRFRANNPAEWYDLVMAIEAQDPFFKPAEN